MIINFDEKYKRATKAILKSIINHCNGLNAVYDEELEGDILSELNEIEEDVKKLRKALTSK